MTHTTHVCLVTLLLALSACRPAASPATSLHACLHGRVLGSTLPEPCAPEVAPTEGPVAAPAPRWRMTPSHSDAWDYSLAAVGTVGLIVQLVVLTPIRPTLRWDDPILFDTAVRKALWTPGAAKAEVDTAWTLLGLQLAYPVLVDVPYVWAHRDPQLARDLFWQDAVTLTLASAVDLGLRDIVGRARPGTYDCLQQGQTNCLDSPEATRSFPGGHTAIATAASVLTCTQHLYIGLYGGPWDGITCAATLASDVTLAMFRIMSDNHWATDQISGLAIGGLIGWSVPYVMHYRHRPTAGDGAPAAPTTPTALVVPMPLTLDHGAGLGLNGLF